MNKFFAIIGGVVIVVLAALFAVPAMIDWSRYRSSFETEASRLLGRPVRVGNHVRLQLLPSPYISFDNIRIADASGHFDTPLLRVDSFKMQLAIGALLTGSLVAQDISMTAPMLRLAIDADGHGNWAGIGGTAGNAAGGELGGLALNAVHIDHGTIELEGAAGWHTRFEDVTGDLDSPALTGPYRFKGQVSNAGKPVDVRFSANLDGATGTTRTNVVWHDAAAGAASYTLSGSIEKLDTNPSLTGTIGAQLPAANGSALAVDAKAVVVATPDQAKLSGIDVLFDGGARAQRMTGTALFNWRDSKASVADLAAVWLDLDKIGGSNPSAGPLATLRKLIERLGAPVATQEQSRLNLRIAEARIGGGTVSDVALAATNTGHGLAIESLTARLPGLSRVDASGSLDTGDSGRFNGQVRLWGANLGAMANWAIPGAAVPDNGNASTYLLEGAVTADAGHFRTDRLRAEVSETTVTGGVVYTGLEPRSLSVSLDSGRLDLAKLLDAPLASAALSSLLTPPTNDDDKTGANDAPTGLHALLSGDTHLDLRIGRLITAQGGLRDVSAKLDRSNGRLDIPAIDLSTDDGVKLHVEGALASKAGAAVGQLRLTVAAPDAKSVSQAAKLVGVSDMPAAATTALAAMTPLSLAGSLQIGGTGVDGEQLRLDGSANGSRANIVVDRDASDTDVLGTRIDIAAQLSNPDGGRLLAQLAQALGSSLPLPADAGGGKLVLRLSGVPRTGILTSASVESAALHGTFEGRSAVGEPGQISFDGALGIDAAAGSTPLILAHFDRLLPAVDGPLKLTARVKREAGALTVSDARATFGGQTVTGEARLDTATTPPKLSASLAAATLRLDKLLAVLAPGDSTLPFLAAASPPGSVALSAWPEQSFDFAAISGFAAQLDATASKLVLSQGVEITDAKLNAASGPGALELTLMQGHLAGGDVSGHAKLSKETAGAGFALETTLAGAQLDGLGGASSGLPKPQGLFGMTARLAGHGLSPRDLVAAAVGAGDFSMSEGSIEGIAPLGIDAAAREVLADPVPAVTAAALEQRLNKTRFLAPFPMLGAHGAIAIADGSARFDRLKVQSSKADLEIAARIDLATLQLTSTFTVSPKSPLPDQPPLPAVQFAFEGPLTAFAAVPPVIDAAELERDLTSRKLLGGPEQMVGIWPVAPPPAAPAEPSAPVAQSAASPGAAAAAAAAPSATLATNTTPSVPVAAPANTAPSVPPVTIVAADQATAAAAGVQAPADKPAQPAHARRKKTNWASALFQNLFGN